MLLDGRVPVSSLLYLAFFNMLEKGKEKLFLANAAGICNPLAPKELEKRREKRIFAVDKSINRKEYDNI